jgi:hypothetical protein
MQGQYTRQEILPQVARQRKGSWIGPAPGRERFAVGAVVVNLRGRGSSSRDMVLPDTAVRTFLGVEERNLVDEDASAVLAGIADGTLARSLLPWIPLMQGGGEAAIIQQWVEQARQEPDSRRRSDYGGLALVFAEAAGCRKDWKEALKGWNMVESEQVLEWISEGRAEGQAEALLRVLARRFPPGPAVEMVAAIRAMKDLGRLGVWLDAAATADSFDAFRQGTGL